MLRILFVTSLVFAVYTASMPINAREVTSLTLSGLLTVAPNSQSCASAPFPTECRTADQALPLIIAAFNTYDITHPAVQAALLSLMAYESGEFVYNQNHFPGVPGQGTRNMQSPTYNAMYATSLGIGSFATGSELMQAVGADQYTFASAAWFITTQCDFRVRENMWSGSKTAWEAYLTGCVGTVADEGRVAYWTKAMGVLGVSIEA